MINGIGKQRAERVFLRIACDSAVKERALAAGFFAYSDETLYRRPPMAPPPAPELPVRHKAKADAMGIYQLYTREVPANVRAIEGATFREWHAAQEKLGGRATDLVIEDGGAIEGWVRLANGDVSRVTALSSSGYDDLLACGLSLLGGQEAFCLAPNHSLGLRSALERLDFEAAGTYTVLARRLAKPAAELAPERSKEAVPVG
jgi:hypothetical protein